MTPAAAEKANIIELSEKKSMSEIHDAYQIPCRVQEIKIMVRQFFSHWRLAVASDGDKTPGDHRSLG